MSLLDRIELMQFIEPKIGSFHDKRLARLKNLSLPLVLKRKNPYLFRAKNQITAQDLVRSILDAYLSSQEETIFGEFMEELAVYVCSRVYSGRKSSAEGIDLEFEKDNILYFVTIKSGPNWGNSQQYKRMADNFRKAIRIRRTNTGKITIHAINGCCYGKDDRPDKGDYWKLCGQRFWEFISGDENLYIEIIEPIGHRAKEKNEYFQNEYGKTLNRFTKEFIDKFCDSTGLILWEKLVQFNSGKGNYNI